MRVVTSGRGKRRADHVPDTVASSRSSVGRRTRSANPSCGTDSCCGKPYLTTHAFLHDQHGTEKAERWATLVLPATAAEVARFATA